MKASEPISIHLIDDDEMFLKALQHQLQGAFKDSIKTRCFVTGEEFLKNMDSEKPDIVVLDHILNSRSPFAMDGMYVMQKIKQKDSDIPVVILSGQNKIEIALNCVKNGAYDYVIKNDNAFLKTQNILKSIVRSGRLSTRFEIFKNWAAVMISFACLVSLVVIILKAILP